MLIELQHWRRIIDELGRRHLEPLGLDVWELVTDIERSPQFRQRYWEEQLENPYRYYIEVGKDVTADTVQKAFKLITSHQENRLVRRGQKERDLLLCIQLALLNTRYNEPDKKDSRRGTWSYPRLAQRYKDYYRSRGFSERLLTPRGVKEHVKIGRQVLEAESDRRT